MSITRLQGDLLNDFKEQKAMVVEQTELFDPMATALRTSAAQRLAHKAALIITEIVCYLASATTVAATIFMNHIYPFTPLQNVRYIHSLNDIKSLKEEEYLSIVVHALAGFIALLFYIIARMTRSIRLKNNILNLAGKNVKILMGQHLKRKAAVESLEQRHLLDLPSFGGTVSMKNLANTAYATVDNIQ
ncbi:MAG TPA: hypothetical protein PL009_14740 [Flavipsychrobacter sp.]|nr:hypothetical protein [Flavipsychrobacter sp.]